MVDYNVGLKSVLGQATLLLVRLGARRYAMHSGRCTSYLEVLSPAGVGKYCCRFGC